MFLLLADATIMILEIIAVEGLTTVDADESSRAARTTNMIVALFFLQSLIAILAYKGYHFDC